MSEIILKIDEIPKQHVGRGRAIVDPKILEDTKWSTGQILELTYNKKTHVIYTSELQIWLIISVLYLKIK